METISEIVEGELYLSSLLAATQAADSLNSKGITHVISILKEPFSRNASIEYLVVGEDDTSDTDLLKHFQAMNAFIGTPCPLSPPFLSEVPTSAYQISLFILLGTLLHLYPLETSHSLPY
jgi:hypothetical protein